MIPHLVSALVNPSQLRCRVFICPVTTGWYLLSQQMRTEKLYGNKTHVENVYILFMNSPGSTKEHLKSQMSGVTDSYFRKENITDVVTVKGK